MKLSKTTFIRLAAIGSVLTSVWALVVGALPTGTFSDKLLYAGLFVRLFAAELVPLALFAVVIAAGYLLYPEWAASAPVRWLQVSSEARKTRLLVRVSATCLAMAFAAIALMTVLTWARYTFIYLREDLLGSHLRRMVLLDAHLEESRGDLPLAVEKLQRFARMFPDRAKANDISEEVERLEEAMDESRELDQIADQLEQSAGTSEAVLELRSMALAIWPGQSGIRDKLSRSEKSWGEALDAYFAFRSRCQDAAAFEPKQVALSLVVLGYRHPQDFPGAADLADANKPLCAVANALAEDVEIRSQVRQRAQKFVASTSEDQLTRRAKAWAEQAWIHDPNRYHSARMRAVMQGLWYRLTWGPVRAEANTASDDEEEAMQQGFSDSPFLHPALMLDETELLQREASTGPSQDARSWPIKVIAGQRGDLLLCWSKPAGLPDIALSGSASASVATPSAGCVAAERDSPPLNLRTVEVRQQVADLLSAAAERVAQQTSAADRRAMKSLCVMVARVSAIGANASEAAAATCKLEILVDNLGRRPQK